MTLALEFQGKKPERRERTAGISRNRTRTVLQRSGKVKKCLGRAEDQRCRSQVTCPTRHKGVLWSLLCPRSPSSLLRRAAASGPAFALSVTGDKKNHPGVPHGRKSQGPNLALHAAARAPRTLLPTPGATEASDAQQGSRPEQRGLTRAGGK